MQTFCTTSIGDPTLSNKRRAYSKEVEIDNSRSFSLCNLDLRSTFMIEQSLNSNFEKFSEAMHISWVYLELSLKVSLISFIISSQICEINSISLTLYISIMSHEVIFCLFLSSGTSLLLASMVINTPINIKSKQTIGDNVCQCCCK